MCERESPFVEKQNLTPVVLPENYFVNSDFSAILVKDAISRNFC